MTSHVDFAVKFDYLLTIKSITLASTTNNAESKKFLFCGKRDTSPPRTPIGLWETNFPQKNFAIDVWTGCLNKKVVRVAVP